MRGLIAKLVVLTIIYIYRIVSSLNGRCWSLNPCHWWRWRMGLKKWCCLQSQLWFCGLRISRRLWHSSIRFSFMTLIILPFSPTVTKIIICFKINVHTYFFNFFNSFFTQLKRAKEELGRQLHHYFCLKGVKDCSLVIVRALGCFENVPCTALFFNFRHCKLTRWLH